MTFLEVDNLTKRYGADVLALQRVSFSIARGEWVSAMGPSGSGKSTLLKHLIGLYSPMQGDVLISGESL